MPFGAPAQHAAGQVRDVPEAGLLQHDHRLRRTRAGAAHGDDGAVRREFPAAAGELGLPTSEPSLRELIDAAPAPWDAILRDHHEAFLQMTAEVEELTRSNTELLTRGYNATRDYLNALHGATLVDAYSAKGTGETFGGTTHVIDRAF